VSLFKRKVVLFSEKSLTVGEFDIDSDGAYRNVKTFPVDVKGGKDLYVSIKSDRPVDVDVVGIDGRSIKFKEAFLNGVIGPLETVGKGTMEVILGVYRGDLSNLEMEIWME